MVHPPTVAAIYSRLSLDRGGTGLGVARQEEDCANLLQRQGFGHGPVYRENAKSASTLTKNRRPVYDAMLRHAEERRFSAIIAHSTSRLTRRPSEYEQLVQLVARCGVQVWTVTAGRLDLESADGRAMARILAAMDAAETERLGERASRAALQRAGSDIWLGGNIPSFGYELAPRPGGGKRLVPNAEATAWLRDAAALLLAGSTVLEVTRHWNERGYRTALGLRWKVTDLRRILLSPHTAGRRIRGGVLSEQLWMPALDLNTWNAVGCVVQVDPGRFLTRAPRRALSSLAFCGHCDAPLETCRNRAGFDVYACMYSLHRGCERVRIRAEALEVHVGALMAVSRHRPPVDAVPLTTLALTRLRTVQSDHYERLLDRDGYRRQLNRLLTPAAAMDCVGLVELLDVAVSERPPKGPRYQVPTTEQTAARVSARWTLVRGSAAAAEAIE